jgi:hypothetical protein
MTRGLPTSIGATLPFAAFFYRRWLLTVNASIAITLRLPARSTHHFPAVMAFGLPIKPCNRFQLAALSAALLKPAKQVSAAVVFVRGGELTSQPLRVFAIGGAFTRWVLVQSLVAWLAA